MHCSVAAGRSLGLTTVVMTFFVTRTIDLLEFPLQLRDDVFRLIPGWIDQLLFFEEDKTGRSNSARACSILIGI